MDLPCCSICWLSLVYGKPLSFLSSYASSSSSSHSSSLVTFLSSFTYWRSVLSSSYLYNPSHIQLYSPLIDDLVQYILSDTTLLPEPLPAYPLHTHDLRRLLLSSSSSSSSSSSANNFTTPSVNHDHLLTPSYASSEYFSRPLRIFEPALVEAIQDKYKYSLTFSSNASSSSSVSPPTPLSFFLKFNGKCPLDSISMNDQGLRISNISQLYTLCSTSNILRQAIDMGRQHYTTIQTFLSSLVPENPDKDTKEKDDTRNSNTIASFLPSSFHTLVLTRYRIPSRSNEFRIFIRNYTVRGISQRHTSEHFPGLTENSRQNYIEYIVPLFYQHIVRSKVLIPSLAIDCVVQENYDIYNQLTMNNRTEQSYEDTQNNDTDGLRDELIKNIKIMDIVPADATLDTLLFEWEELYGTVEEGGNILPCGHPHLPKKVTDTCQGFERNEYGNKNLTFPELPLLVPLLRIVKNKNIRFHPLASHGLPLDIQEMAYEKVYNNSKSKTMEVTNPETMVHLEPPNNGTSKDNHPTFAASSTNTDSPSNGMGWSSMIDQLQSLGLFYRPNDNDTTDTSSGSDTDTESK